MKNGTIITAKHIGYNVIAKGSTYRDPQSGKVVTASVTLLSESGVDEGAFFPAQDILVNGAEHVRNLRDFCDELLKDQEAVR